jgi:hypothetical protein
MDDYQQLCLAAAVDAEPSTEALLLNEIHNLVSGVAFDTSALVENQKHLLAARDAEIKDLKIKLSELQRENGALRSLAPEVVRDVDQVFRPAYPDKAFGTTRLWKVMRPVFLLVSGDHPSVEIDGSLFERLVRQGLWVHEDRPFNEAPRPVAAIEHHA